MIRLTRNQIQEKELEILLEVDRFCKDKGLRYYLAGGTLLGAIRHQGFIPWDDDIDICMPRPDFEDFIRTFKARRSYYHLESNLNKKFYIPFAKIFNLNTKVNMKLSHSETSGHLWIDVLPVDGLPANMEEVKKIYGKCDRYRRILSISEANVEESKTTFKKWAKILFLQPVIKLYGIEKVVQKLDQIGRRLPYESSSYVGIVTWGLYGAGERMLKSEFEKATEVEFEGYKFPAFSCWDSYLHGLYGDYMQLPPAEKRQTHDMEAYLLEEGEF